MKSARNVIFTCVASLTLLGCATPNAPSPSLPVSKTPEMKIITLDEAMNRSLIRAMPLNIAIPKAYKLFPDEPYVGNHLWTTQQNYDALQKNGTSDRSEGVLQLRISLDVRCGPNLTALDLPHFGQPGDGDRSHSRSRPRCHGAAL